MVFFGTMKSANWPRHCATEVPLGDGRPLSVTEMHRLPGAQPVASELAGARGAGGGAGAVAAGGGGAGGKVFALLASLSEAHADARTHRTTPMTRLLIWPGMAVSTRADFASRHLGEFVLVIAIFAPLLQRSSWRSRAIAHCTCTHAYNVGSPSFTN